MCCFIINHYEYSRVSTGIETCDPSPSDRPPSGPIPDTAGAATQPDGVAMPKGGNSKHGRRVLLLEDDARISEMLAGAGWSVSVTKSGLDALKELMAADFTAILCDMSMPGMSGNLLYRAIERARPHLCERFICMAERPGQAGEHGLLKSTNGHLLLKPVDLEELMDVLTFVEARTQFIDFFDEQGRAAKQDEIESSMESPVVTQTLDGRTIRVQRADRRHPISRTTVGAFAALLVVAAAHPITVWRDSGIQKRAEALSSELISREGQWTETLARLQDVEKARQKLAAFVALKVKIQSDRKSIRWTSGLQSVATAIGPDIELRAFTARDNPEIQGGFTFRLSGISSGTEPRLKADRFRTNIENNLKQTTSAQAVQTRFDDLEESSPALAKAGARSGTVFTISVTAASASSGDVEKKGER